MSEVIWRPKVTEVADSALADFIRFVNKKHHANIELSEYSSIYDWSVRHIDTFWSDLAAFMGLEAVAAARPILLGESMNTTQWFPGATLNYAEFALRETSSRSQDDLTVIEVSEDGSRRTLTLSELRDLVARVQAGMLRLGVKQGDVVAGVLPNRIEAIVSFLATASIGAIWTTCSPEFGDKAILDRLTQMNPVLLIASQQYRYAGKIFDNSNTISSLVDNLPSLRANVIVSPDAITSDSMSLLDWDHLIESPGDLTFEPVEFSHPLWVLFSSGTTGLPKGIIHGHGGILLEHFKNLRLHHGLTSGSRFFWFTTTGWMMWNYLISGLIVEATLVLYDGSPGWPDLSRLWQLAADEDVTLLGVSAPFIHACMKSGIDPSCKESSTLLTSIGSTGAPLSPEAFDWLSSHWGGRVQITSASGGTDVCTAFLATAPNTPVWRGEISCAALGVDARSYSPDALPLRDSVGELVITQPMPSMPVGLWNDADGSRYRETYFSHFPGIWRHGDWSIHTSHGSFVVMGRSDATLNRAGIRTGTADYYRVIEQVEGVADSLVVEIPNSDTNEDGDIVLFIVAESNSAPDVLTAQIREAVKTGISPRHVPDSVHFIPKIPKTLNGKKCEVPVKRILLGAEPQDVINIGSLQDPGSLKPFIELANSEPSQAS